MTLPEPCTNCCQGRNQIPRTMKAKPTAQMRDTSLTRKEEPASISAGS
jgi:hypothetical protein